MKTVIVGGALVHLMESKARCPHCRTKQPYDALEPGWIKTDNLEYRWKCVNKKCGKRMMITQDIRGDFVSYKCKKDMTKEELRNNYG